MTTTTTITTTTTSTTTRTTITTVSPALPPRVTPAPIVQLTTVQSSITLIGVTEPNPQLKKAVGSAIASTLQVDRSQVTVFLETQRRLATRRMQDEAVSRLRSTPLKRRLLKGGLVVAFEVVFEQVLPAVGASSEDAAPNSPQGQGSGLTGSNIAPVITSVDKAMADLQTISQNPAAFMSTLVVAFEEQGAVAPASLQVEMAPPAVVSVVAQAVPQSWGNCRREDATIAVAACEEGRSTLRTDTTASCNCPGQRHRSIRCADASQQSVASTGSSRNWLSNQVCEKITNLTESETCWICPTPDNATVLANSTDGQAMEEEVDFFHDILGDTKMVAILSASGMGGVVFLSLTGLLLHTSVIRRRRRVKEKKGDAIISVMGCVRVPDQIELEMEDARVEAAADSTNAQAHERYARCLLLLDRLQEGTAYCDRWKPEDPEVVRADADWKQFIMTSQRIVYFALTIGKLDEELDDPQLAQEGTATGELALQTIASLSNALGGAASQQSTLARRLRLCKVRAWQHAVPGSNGETGDVWKQRAQDAQLEVDRLCDERPADIIENLPLRHCMALCSLRTGMRAQAIEHLREEWSTQHTPSVRLLQELVAADAEKEAGNAAFTRLDWELSEQHYSAALANDLLRLDPAFSSSVFHNRSASRHKRRECEGALADVESAMTLFPRYAKALFRRGVLRMEWACNYAGAHEDFELVQTVEPGFLGLQEWRRRAEKWSASPPEHNYFKILGVGFDANDPEIKRGYKRAALRWHPDKNPDNQEQASEMFKEVRMGYDTLLDIRKRRVYAAGPALPTDGSLVPYTFGRRSENASASSSTGPVSGSENRSTSAPPATAAAGI